MSDAPAPLLTTPSFSTAGGQFDHSTPQGLGATLRILRLSKELSIAEISARLKFSARQVEALEAEDWAHLPGGLPLRGLVKNYARVLEADVQLMLDLLDTATPQARLPRRVLGSDATGGLIRADTLFEETTSRSTWGWLAVIALLVLVAVFYIISRGWLPDALADWFK